MLFEARGKSHPLLGLLGSAPEGGSGQDGADLPCHSPLTRQPRLRSPSGTRHTTLDLLRYPVLLLAYHVPPFGHVPGARWWAGSGPRLPRDFPFAVTLRI